MTHLIRLKSRLENLENLKELINIVWQEGTYGDHLLSAIMLMGVRDGSHFCDWWYWLTSKMADIRFKLKSDPNLVVFDF